MSGKMDTLLKVCEILSESKNLRVSFKEVTKVDNMSYFGDMYGGKMGYLTGTPNNMLSMTSRIKPIQKVLREDLTYRQKVELTKRIDRILKPINIIDTRNIATIITQNGELSAKVINTILDYLIITLKIEVV